MLFLGADQGPKTVLGSTSVVDQLLFSIVPSILTFDFDLILESFFTFWGPNGLILGSGVGSKIVFGSTHVVEQLLFSKVPSILTLDWVIFGFRIGLENCFWVYSCS